MDLFSELKIYVKSFSDSAPLDSPFWVHVATHITALSDFCGKSKRISQEELLLHVQEIKSYMNQNSQIQTGFNMLSGERYYAANDEVELTQGKIIKIEQIINKMLELKKEEFDSLVKCDDSELKVVQKQPCIFIGHGRSQIWNRVNTWLKDGLELLNEDVIYFESKSRAGHHMGDILNGFLDKATFAIIVMTAEDETVTDKIRARQNVIHEIGLFQGRLGFEKVAILRQDGVEPFSNIDGFQYIPFAGDNIQQSFWDLQEMIKREGVINSKSILK